MFSRAAFTLTFLGLLTILFPCSSEAQVAPPSPGYASAKQAIPPPVRDPEAATLLQNSIRAMGGSAPSDSRAIGDITLAAGPTHDTGKIDISTRGLDQCAEHIQLATEQRSVIYSRGDADETVGGDAHASPLELAASSQCVVFPLPLLAGIAADPGATLEYVGAESLNGVATQHIRLTKTFASQSGLEYLAEFTKRDLWLDAATGLPLKLAYLRREAQGRVAAVRIEVQYSDWRNVNGIPYPHRVDKSWNGMPWATLSIHQITFNTGLTNDDFPILPRRNGVPQ